METTNLSPYIIFLIDKEKDTEDPTGYKQDGKLRMRVRWGKSIVAFSVGYRVKLSQWNLETQRCSAKTTNLKKQSASEINGEIQRLETLMNNVFKAFELQNHTPTTNEVRKSFNEAVGRENRRATGDDIPEVKIVGLYDRLTEFVKEMGTRNSWTLATYQKFNALTAHLKEFAPKLEFTDLTESGLTQWVEFLRNNKEMRNTTIGKQLGFLKWFLRWATAKGYNTTNDYVLFAPKLKTAEKKVVFLDWDELMTVYNFDIPAEKKYLDRVRDVFCFCAFTSLRYSDVANLKRSDVFDKYISITTVKTSDSLTIDLNDYSRTILNKYSAETFAHDLALPVISNQKMNDYLKELGKLCGIDAPITITYYKGNNRTDEVKPKYELMGTHTGRRTFICNALMLGIAPQVVMKWTGHSDYKAMKPYIDVADKAKSDAMNLFNKK